MFIPEHTLQGSSWTITETLYSSIICQKSRDVYFRSYWKILKVTGNGLSSP